MMDDERSCIGIRTKQSRVMVALGAILFKEVI
jgi:hypothetical protein